MAAPQHRYVLLEEVLLKFAHLRKLKRDRTNQKIIGILLDSEQWYAAPWAVSLYPGEDKWTQPKYLHYFMTIVI